LSNYPRIDEASYCKLVFQARGQFMAILNVFNCYGLGDFIVPAIEECMKVTENFAMAVRGKDTPIHILEEPKKRATER